MASSLSLTTLIPVSATVSRHLTFLTFAVNDEIDTRRPHGILKELKTSSSDVCVVLPFPLQNRHTIT
ncbi:hypothetical protein Csa_010848 [Cucumis sativus]|uniref:Uncharacterized protein n=1 Tax=Cucumis sativus TaxID=3659 RepID=A0A0A0L7K0_CUCSA|nr:hypothetical protein Csa_010848 [Cucumis sativus]